MPSLAADELIFYLALTKKLRAKNGQLRGYAYSSVEHWLLLHGRLWTPPSVTVPMRPRQCFDNAFNMVWNTRRRRQRDQRLRYVEGYAMAIIPVLHAWCVNGLDQVVEPTWTEPGVAYFGAVFELDAVQERRRVGSELSMLDDWERRYPLLRTPSSPAVHG